jgi:Fe-S cluster assembly scaffold protein SufB
MKEITLNQAIEHAANHDELDLKISALFEAFHEKQKIQQKETLVREEMAAYAVYIARCDKAIAEIDNILNESTKYLRGQKLCLAS